MKSKQVSFLLAIAICGSMTTFAQKGSSQLTLAKGQKFQIDNTTKSVVNMEMMGQAMDITSDVTMLREIAVKERNNATYSISSTITKMKTSSSMMGQEMSYDSEKPEDATTEIGKVVSKQVNAPKEAELDFSGKLLNVKKDTASADGNPMAGMMQSMSGTDAAIGSADLVQVLPAGKKAGDSWTDSSSADGMKMVTTYTIKEIKGNDATVSFTGTQSTNKVVDNQGMEVNVTMEAKISGETIVDMTTGIIKQRTTSLDGTGSADVMGQSIPMTTKVTTSSTVKVL